MQKIKENVVAQLVEMSCSGDVIAYLPYELACLRYESNEQSYIYELRTGTDCRTNMIGKVSESGVILTYFPIYGEFICDSEVNKALAENSIDLDYVWSLITKANPLAAKEVAENIEMYKTRMHA